MNRVVHTIDFDTLDRNKHGHFSYLCHLQVSSLEVREKYIGFLLVVVSYFHGFIHLRFKHAVPGHTFQISMPSAYISKLAVWK